MNTSLNKRILVAIAIVQFALLLWPLKVFCSTRDATMKKPPFLWPLKVFRSTRDATMKKPPFLWPLKVFCSTRDATLQIDIHVASCTSESKDLHVKEAAIQVGLIFVMIALS